MDVNALEIIDPILITGCARSGTSLTAGIIHLCGAQKGLAEGKSKYNAKGQFENTAIRDHVTKPYLRSIGADPMCQKPLPDVAQVIQDSLSNDFIKRWRSLVLESFYAQDVALSKPWFYKGAKMCLMWQIWHNAFPTSKWIIVRRDSNDIAESCMKTSFMRAYNTKADWIDKWIRPHLMRFAEMHSHFNCFEVWPDRAVKGDFSQIKEMINFCGLTFNEEEVTNFITPSLWGKKP